jgi:hypothetical protein
LMVYWDGIHRGRYVPGHVGWRPRWGS